MYAIYDNIYRQYTPNVSIYTIHGSYGYVFLLFLQLLYLQISSYNTCICIYIYISRKNMLHISGISLLRSSIERNTHTYGYMYGYVFSLCIIIGWSWFGKHHSLLGIHQVAYNDAVPKFRGEGAGVAGCGGLNNDVETGLFVIPRS